MSIAETFFVGKRIVYLQASSVLRPQAQPHVDFRIRFSDFDSLVSRLPESIHRFHLGQIPLPNALPAIVSSIVAYLHELYVDLRGLDIATILGLSSLAAEEMQRTGGSALELFVYVCLLEEFALMLDCILETRPAEEEMTDAVYDYYLDQVFSARDGGFGGVPASRSFIRSLKRSAYGRGDNRWEKECVICLEEFDAEAKVSEIPCSHVFHSQCIIHWLKRSHLCPTCRYPMPSASFHLQHRPNLLEGTSASQNRISRSGGPL